MTFDPTDLASSAAAVLARAATLPDRLALPATRAEVVATFGDPGRGVAAKPWVRAQIVTCRHVNGDRPGMPGVPDRFYFQTHRLVEPLMREAFARAREAAPDYAIERAASFVFRHERHDPRRQLSLHSWGIAVDIDSQHNRAIEFAPDKGKRRPAAWSEEWRRLWPRGLSRAFVEAFEGVGFVWGGRWTSYVDPMHFQWARTEA